MKVSFIATVYNEEASVEALLESLMKQSKMPDEIIIVDGGSRDHTVAQIQNHKSKLKVFVKKGNRAVGRNEAVKRSSNEIIVCSDSGCILDKDWIKNITEPFEDPKIEVVAGYYKGSAKTVFQKCLIPYVLVMPDKVDKDKFLPSTRSIAFKKSIWKKVGGFEEKFNNNEDYVFAKRLKEISANIIFEIRAIVYWKPRKNLKDAFIMFYRFAKGDSESHIFRPKVFFIFLRYVLGLILLLLFLISRSYIILNTIYLILSIYIFWSIVKNYKYVKDARAILLLPLIQIISDKAVILGTINGLLNERSKILIEGFSYISIIYLIILLSFRQLRSLFSSPKITEHGIVAYAQYFKYPLYFETILFFVFILSPIVVFFILSKVRKHKE